jgi:hypothetical protein
MQASPDVDARAARVLTHALENLPLRRAPAELEVRVLQQLERRRSLDWWRRGFTHWPLAVRAGFVVICIPLVIATLVDWRWSSWAYLAVGSIVSAADLVTRITSALPERWLFTIASVAATLYAVLFALGTLAYRTLYLSPPSRRVIP